MKKIARIGFVCAAIAVTLFLVGACGGGAASPSSSDTLETAAQTPTPIASKAPQDLEIDYTKIGGASKEERVASLVSLLNEKSEGFGKIFGYSSNSQGATSEDSATIYSYVFMAYGDSGETQEQQEQFIAKVITVLKQVVTYTAKFVAEEGEESIIQTHVFYLDGTQEVYIADSSAITELRKAPADSWLLYTKPISLTLVETQRLNQVLQQLSLYDAAFRIAVSEGYLTEVEFNQIQKKIAELQQSQDGQNDLQPQK